MHSTPFSASTAHIRRTLTVHNTENFSSFLIVHSKNYETAKLRCPFLGGAEAEKANALADQIRNPTLPQFEGVVIKDLDVTTRNTDGTISTVFSLEPEADFVLFFHTLVGSLTLHKTDVPLNQGDRVFTEITFDAATSDLTLT